MTEQERRIATAIDVIEWRLEALRIAEAAGHHYTATTYGMLGLSEVLGILRDGDVTTL